MSFAEVLQKLPLLTVSQRQELVWSALELDGAELPAEDEAVTEQRLAEHRRDSGSAVPLDEVKARLRARPRLRP
jgi:hypothetical protein